VVNIESLHDSRINQYTGSYFIISKDITIYMPKGILPFFSLYDMLRPKESCLGFINQTLTNLVKLIQDEV
jgi:hypothetical protein